MGEDTESKPKVKRVMKSIDEKIVEAREKYEDILTQKAVSEGKTPLGKVVQSAVKKGVNKREKTKLTKDKANSVLLTEFVGKIEPTSEGIALCISALVEICPEPTEKVTVEQSPPEQVAS